MANTTVITGRLVRDPELRKTRDDVSVLSFRIAHDRYVGKGKEKKTDFFNVEAWRATAEFVSANFKKGKPIEITGSIQTSPWEDKNGSKHEGVKIVADKVDFVLTEKAADNDAAGSDEAASPAADTPALPAAPPVQQAADLGAAFAGFGEFTPDFSAVFSGAPAGGGDFTEVQDVGDLPF